MYQHQHDGSQPILTHPTAPAFDAKGTPTGILPSPSGMVLAQSTILTRREINALRKNPLFAAILDTLLADAKLKGRIQVIMRGDHRATEYASRRKSRKRTITIKLNFHCEVKRD